MKKNKKYLALMMLAAMSMMVFAGCGNNEATSSANGSASSEASSSAAPEDEKAPADKENADKADQKSEDDKTTEGTEGSTLLATDAELIGAVTLTDGATLTVDYYEANGSSTDLLTATGASFTEVGNSEMVTLADMSAIERVENGKLVSATADDIQTGSMVAVVNDGNGGKKLIILDIENTVASNNSASSQNEGGVEAVPVDPANENTAVVE